MHCSTSHTAGRNNASLPRIISLMTMALPHLSTSAGLYIPGVKALIAAWWSTLQLQIRGNHEPHAFKTLAGGLAGGRISSVGIEGMAVVLDLVAVCGRISAQLAGKRTWTRGDS